MGALIDAAKRNEASLAIFKPKRFVSFSTEETERSWDPELIEAIKNESAQTFLLPGDDWRAEFKPVRKLPYHFKYTFEDVQGRRSTMAILDWEIGMLYWNCMTQANEDETQAIGLVRARYEREFFRKDLHLILGTTQAWQKRAPNPWTIIGVIPFPHDKQLSLPL